MKISFIGTGLMGNPLAEKLLEAGYKISVYNRSIEKTENLKKLGAIVFKESTESIKSSDTIFLMVSDGKVVESILFPDSDPPELKEKTIVQMSTISPKEGIQLADKVLRAGGSYVEAPVLGSIQQVKESSLFVMLAGDVKVIEEYKPLLKLFGELIYVGGVGKAAALKLALNQLIASLTSAFSISLGIVLKENIDVNIFMDILRRSALYAPTFDKKLTNMLNRNFQPTNFPTKHLLKDVNLVIDEADSLNIETAGLIGVRKVIEQAIKLGLVEKDYSSIYNAINKE